MQLVIALVRSGQALTCLPDFVLMQAQLSRLHVSDCAYDCIEQAYLTWRPSTASGWQDRLVASLRKQHMPSPIKKR